MPSSINDSVPGYNFDVVHGAEYVLDLSRPVGARVRDLRVDGRPVAPGDSFTLALNSYRQEGGGGYAMLRGARAGVIAAIEEAEASDEDEAEIYGPN